jgi:hypothetical protein
MRILPLCDAWGKMLESEGFCEKERAVERQRLAGSTPVPSAIVQKRSFEEYVEGIFPF